MYFAVLDAGIRIEGFFHRSRINHIHHFKSHRLLLSYPHSLLDSAVGRSLYDTAHVSSLDVKTCLVQSFIFKTKPTLFFQIMNAAE
jgi:hypothetical protein